MTLKISTDLIGKTITKIEYLSKKEADDLGWSKRPLVICFDDGTYIGAMADDEGNNGGSYFTSDPENHTIYCRHGD